MLAAVSTPLPCAPPAIQFILSNIILFFSQPETITKRKNHLSACNLVVADAAVAVDGFAAVGTNAFAVVDGVAAVFATRLLSWLFLQQFSPLLHFTCRRLRIKVS